jgi:hypothetical protein
MPHPGGNITGSLIQQTDLAGKRLEPLHELVPGLLRLAILANVGYPAAVLEMGTVLAKLSELLFVEDAAALCRGGDVSGSHWAVHATI